MALGKYDVGEDLIKLENGKQEMVTDQDLIPLSLFPFDIFPPKMIEVIEKISNSLHVEPEVVTGLMLAVISGALGNTIRISPKQGYEVPLFLWLIIIAPTGYGKSPAIQILTKYIKKLQARSYQDYQLKLREYELKMRKAKQESHFEYPEKPKIEKHFFVSDNTVESLGCIFEIDRRGIIIFRDEIAGFILGLDQYRGKGDDQQHYLELFNCDTWKIDRKSGVKFIQNTGAVIIGGIQPKVMPRVFNIDLFDNGMLPRFLLLNSENRTMKFSRETITEDILTYWDGLLGQCYNNPLIYDNDGFVKPQVLILSNKALNIWTEFHDNYGTKKPFLSEKAQVFIPKLIAYYSLKFAGILHAVLAFNSRANINSLIEDDTIYSAIRLTDYFAGQAIKTLKLYEQSNDTLNEFHKELIKTLHGLQGEVKNNSLPLKRIGEEYNRVLPQPLKPEKVRSILVDLGLTTKKSTGNYSYLLWEPEKMQKLFNKTTVTSVTTITNPSKKVTEVTEVTEVFDEI